MNDRFNKICIIGAGPAGSMSAYLLKKSGFDVVVIDKYSTPKRKVCGEYLCPSGVNLLSQQGLDSIVEDFNRVHGMKIVSPKGRTILSFFPEGRIMNHGVSVNRSLFDQRLRELGKSVGCKYIEGHAVTNIQKEGSSWKVILDRGDEVFCDLVVGADGINSPTAQIFGHKDFIDTKRIALHVYIPLKDRKFYSRLGQMHITKDGSYVGLNPINENEINFSIVCSKEKLQDMSRKEIINEAIKSSEILRSYFDEIDDGVKINTAGSIKNRNNFIAGEGIAYVGDSAGFIDPLTGEGMYNSLQGAIFLNEALLKNRNNFGLKAYKKKKKKFFKEKNILNNIFQLIIKTPFLCEIIASFLIVRQKRADTFIGIIGNIYKPLEGIKKLIFQS
ncbi:hypothetical protein BIY24_03850 [Halobacteriovorax marinus]|uniref:NAD(P)/FAD-dependent oxidoreductase n=1 Tax=Halobacteriovorax marinus TaxID=97084 RepID=UPI000BC35D16|nr:NAD(P)/FAD-dependent oxidoreductase [Halobacteriovorax marinus]ATH07100.1 hypothetical protein BIY24_03850 [Halobacteriovorax marinus]